MMVGFLGRDRLIYGPWSAFERMVVRLFLHQGNPQVEYTGGPGDKGCDIFVVTKDFDKLVIQCKFTHTESDATKEGVEDIHRACISYDANMGLLCINNQNISPGAKNLLSELGDLGFEVGLWNYHNFRKISNNLAEYSAHRKECRDYQLEAVIESVASLKNSGRALVEMATGLGKTVVMAEVIDRFLQEKPEARILVLAHSNPIISQVERAIWSQLSKNIMTHILSGAEKPILDEGVTVATFESLISDYKNGRDLPIFDMVLVDECHHAYAKTYAEIIDAVSYNSLLMGVTATPWRGDEQDISEIFGKPVYKMGIIEGINRGWLSRIRYEMFCDNIDWEHIGKISKEGHTIKSLNSKLFLPARDGEIVDKVISEWHKEDNPKIITFCQSKEHARQLTEAFNEMGLATRFLTSEHSEKERAEAFTDFRLENFHNLIGVDILNEGVDIPDVGIIVFARITHSRRIFIQQLGRGLRVTETKKSVKIMDFVADIRRLGALSKINRKARGLEIFTDTDMIEFDPKVKTNFVEEYLADVADLDDNEKPKLNYLISDSDME